MAIPVALQNFKVAGIYRLVYDKSTVLNEDTSVLRLIVGYSEKGAFNTPVYVTSVSEFKQIFGGISKKLEKRGCYFHRTAIQALQSYHPCLVLNLKKFDGECVDGLCISIDNSNKSTKLIEERQYYVEDIYDTTRFWVLEADKLQTANVLLNGSVRKNDVNKTRYINIAQTRSAENTSTIFIRKANGTSTNGYNITVFDWYTDSDEMPEFLEDKLNSQISDYMAEVYVFNGEFTVDQVQAT